MCSAVFSEVEQFLVAERPRMIRWALKLCGGDTAEAEDLASKTTIRALENQAAYRCGTVLSAWVWTMMRRVRINERRHARFKAQHIDIDDVASPPMVPAGQEGVVLFHETAAILHAMPSWMRDVIVATKVDELDYAATAERLSLEPGTMRSRLFRATAKLRSLVDGQAT
jgi:RNA polymerase sigma-70 factor (ECF subfamily)